MTGPTRRLREIARAIAGEHPERARQLQSLAERVWKWQVMAERSHRALELLEEGNVKAAKEVLETPPGKKCPHCMGSM